jgi:hypothetical protein
MSELTKESLVRTTYRDVVNLVSDLVPPHSVGYIDGDTETEFPGWDGSVKRLALEQAVAEEANLGSSVRARVIGDYESGIAIIMRSRNLFDPRRFGFYIQPAQDAQEEARVEVWQAPAKKPKSGEVYWGIELLDEDYAHPSTPEVADSLVNSLRALTTS